MNNFLYDTYPILVEIFFTFNICFLLIYGVFYSTFSKFGYPLLTYNLGLLTLQTIVCGFFLSINQSRFFLVSWNGFLISDLFTNEAKSIILLVSIAWFLTTFSYIKNERINSFEYWILILLAISAILIILQSYDLLTMYLAIEFQSLTFYILASFKRTSEFSTEAGLKYFVLGAFSSALLLFGSSLIYGLTGLTNLGDISKFLIEVSFNDISIFIGILTGLILVLIALLFKLSAAPFHMWTPDVYEGSPTPVTAFFSIMPKLAILSLLFRFLIFSFNNYSNFWQNIILVCTILSILIGTLNAFSQNKWKRFFAYSSINHVGFFLLALLAGNIDGISSAILYVIIYIITMLGIFSFILTLRFYHYPKHYQTRYLHDLIFLSKTNPILSLSLSLILFSMAGIPPLAGFFAKAFVLLSALKINALGICIFGVLMSCIACFYYIKIIKEMYFETLTTWAVIYPINKTSSLVLGFSLLFILFIFYDFELISVSITSMSFAFLN